MTKINVPTTMNPSKYNSWGSVEQPTVYTVSVVVAGGEGWHCSCTDESTGSSNTTHRVSTPRQSELPEIGGEPGYIGSKTKAYIPLQRETTRVGSFHWVQHPMRGTRCGYQHVGI